ncbi:unnamed protein product [Cyclocybe aegerita]|uniref:Uncharacterized protein n=1 Tax=Cyclocybe aegerita TaxID=1973307 RepID=A0A8S0XGZ2_CYCAE|nr:unnamed protein product [Cyclocybe aegerita]
MERYVFFLSTLHLNIRPEDENRPSNKLRFSSNGTLRRGVCLPLAIASLAPQSSVMVLCSTSDEEQLQVELLQHGFKQSLQSLLALTLAAILLTEAHPVDSTIEERQIQPQQLPPLPPLPVLPEFPAWPAWPAFPAFAAFPAFEAFT